jgi:hypothetical protein
LARACELCEIGISPGHGQGELDWSLRLSEKLRNSLAITHTFDESKTNRVVVMIWVAEVIRIEQNIIRAAATVLESGWHEAFDEKA